MKKLFLSVAALFAVCIVSAQEGVVASYNKGAEMLQSKNYPEAAKLFQKVIPLVFNLVPAQSVIPVPVIRILPICSS